MAKSTITFGCGHTSDLELPEFLQEVLAAVIEKLKTAPCPDCYGAMGFLAQIRARKTATNKRIAFTGDLN